MRLFKKFPFKERPDTATFSCCHVINGEKSILHVVHDEEGDWQFLCGADHTIEEARIVSLQSVYDLDNSVAKLAHLKPGQSADRKTKEDEWVIL